MSSFKNELNRMVGSPSEIQKGIQLEIDSCLNATLDEAVDITYKRIKSEIREKAKNAQYERVGSSKRISGNVQMHPSLYSGIKIKGYVDTLKKMRLEDINQKYVSKYPNMKIDYDNDIPGFYARYDLLNLVEHNPLFGKRYYSYYLTDIAKIILELVQKKTASDDIKVSFSHIQLSCGYHRMEIQNGGDDRSFTGYHGTNGHVMLRYSVEF